MFLLPQNLAGLLHALNLAETLRLRLLRGIQLLHTNIGLTLSNASVLPGESGLRVCEVVIQRSNALLLRPCCLHAALLIFKRQLPSLGAELGLALLAALLIFKRLLLCNLPVLKRLLAVVRIKLALSLLPALC